MVTSGGAWASVINYASCYLCGTETVSDRIHLCQECVTAFNNVYSIALFSYCFIFRMDVALTYLHIFLILKMGEYHIVSCYIVILYRVEFPEFHEP